MIEQEQEQVKRELEEQLERVKQRIQILNMIEERLIRMRELAKTVVDNDLTQKEIEVISREVKSLEEQINLLNIESAAQSN